MDLSISPTGEAEVVHGYGFVRYVKKEGSLWVSEELEGSQALFGATIDHDALGRPHVALRRADGLWHVARDAGGWSWSKIRDVDLVFYDLGRPRVRIDDGGCPAVLYAKDGYRATAGGVELELARRCL